MCNASIAMGAQGAGAAASAVGSYYSAQSQKSSLNLQATLGDINARTAESTAQSALLAGERQEQSVRLRTAQLKSKQTVALAANGVDLSQGSALRTLTDTDVMGDIDANTVKANAVRAAWGYRTQATNFENQALTSRASAGAVSPVMAGATSLLGSASQVASSWYGFNKAGAFSTPSGGSSSLDGYLELNNFFGTRG